MYASNPPFHSFPTRLSVRFQPAFPFDSNPPFHLIPTRLSISCFNQPAFPFFFQLAFPFVSQSTLRLWLIWNWQRRWEGTGAGFGMKKFTYLRDKHTEMYLVHYYTF
ncbi:hypothetical protein K435DRAFT_1924 [Dendrothele bispora CBS 962.96]|uniref:Uncharacterized protein n=1 Tax=Dendrothele bispora (strain CBS 962.96) TaxID=1314807 RepID=A0A4S8MZI1_DENBC|nr:hypothetical protein K435DRAFT_343336 [Dendrothele bispora CBS 962.96]THV08169.1 hypothetical protein K435DRAFT_1924 [Dendrothele bispora CBS 962.96]